MLTPHTHETPITHGTYVRDTYTLRRYELVAPAVLNDGTPSGYPDAIGHALDRAGYGWTAFDGIGSWQGVHEAGRTFVLYAPHGHAPIIGELARRIMADQDAIQVVESPHDVTLVEA